MFSFQTEIPTETEAWQSLSSSLQTLEWYAQNNRPYMKNFLTELHHPLIDEMMALPDKTHLPELYFSRFQKELYQPEKYAEAVQKTKQELPKVQTCFNRIQALQDSWGFKIYPLYTIRVNIYACGGHYGTDKGLIKLGVPVSSRPERLAHVIVHELLHLGIEQNIVRRFHLPQEEKERLVDNLCQYAMQGLINPRPNGTFFQEVAAGASYMDSLVGTQPQTNLVKAVEAYVLQKEKIRAQQSKTI